ncbi:glycosyltransferase family 4 protein [Paraburkholderia sprentiae WSM5005]|uniref:Glycosyltransferase family 4 protein n=1 Tax=Paraburkholderia sprentiae WSM5005 TaxID=754502 RepID=A0A1I9YQX4_9BURK|nr:glycosyltransferase family 1 protein [Paraburkholderia sprentiae]APA89353.1 glycosyltransferase family 4 protein [Paraburkholderia sprentiae WSM5005]
MKLVFAVDAIRPPLTGIGRYAWELANHYQGEPCDVETVRFLSGDRWISSLDDLLIEPGKKKPLQRRFKWLTTLGRQQRVRKLIRHHVCHSPNYFLPGVVERGIATVHDLSVFKFPETHPVERIVQFERNFASTLQRAVHLITDSAATRQEVATFFGWPLDKITAIGLGVRADFHPREPGEMGALAQWNLEPFRYALCVSTLEPRKRIDCLLDAYGSLPIALRRQYPLVIAGGKGWLNDALLIQIEKGQQEGWVLYLGYVPEESLPVLYAGSKAFLYPSIYEGFGLPVLEAIASGVPTLAMNCSSLPEAGSGAAWLVEPGDHDALREGIQRVLCDEKWRKSAISKGLSAARQQTWSRCANATIDVYRKFA